MALLAFFGYTRGQLSTIVGHALTRKMCFLDPGLGLGQVTFKVGFPAGAHGIFKLQIQPWLLEVVHAIPRASAVKVANDGDHYRRRTNHYRRRKNRS